MKEGSGTSRRNYWSGRDPGCTSVTRLVTPRLQMQPEVRAISQPVPQPGFWRTQCVNAS